MNFPRSLLAGETSCMKFGPRKLKPEAFLCILIRASVIKMLLLLPEFC